MNYLEVTRKHWSLFPGEAPAFIRKRVDCLVRSGYLRPSGITQARHTYMVIGGSEEYDRGTDELIKDMV